MNTELREICDGDYQKLQVCPTRLDTHETESRKTYLVIRTQYPEAMADDWHRDILRQAGHVPEGKTNEYNDNHCPACYETQSDDDKSEYDKVDDWGDKEPCRCEAETFHVELLAVNTGIQTKATIAELDSEIAEWSEKSWSKLSNDSKIQLLIERGTFATLWHLSGVNETSLIESAKEQYQQSLMLGGFQLDRPQNAIGSSGWDFMRGDILGGLTND